MLEITEYTDPICSWAWGSEPKLRLLRWRYEGSTSWRRVMGGLVGDSSSRRPDWDPILAAKPMPEYWKKVTQKTGAPYPFAMHYMLRSTDPAGRAVKAAERQGEAVAEAVLRRLRETTFIFGRPPGEHDQILAAVAGVRQLDIARLEADLSDATVAAAYEADWTETRKPNDHVRHLEGDWMGIGNLKHSEGHDRYAFPTLIFSGSTGECTVPGWMPFDAYEAAMDEAEPGSTAEARPDPTPTEAFDRWPMLTPVELDLLCGAGAKVPEGVVSYDWGDGVVYMTDAEATATSGLP
ncbi:MAG: putative DsbA family dithiol-disulfide isomerase [Acidimicrobiales bacterium]|jgi:predicted DsbA family dithiol-disulfide isomerase